jgi:tRNA-2-methylthio-N6-dimethylallyladenosine synthase
MTSFFIETMGCQMNKADSEKAAGLLLRAGWIEAVSAEEADLVLVNGCVVRKKAEDKAINRVKHYLSRRRGQRVGLIGCAAQWRGDDLLEDVPDLHLLLSPSRLRELPELAGSGGIALGTTSFSSDGSHRQRVAGIRAWIPVMRGCDQLCTFCVVPSTRGREESFPPSSILEEAYRAVKSGFLELVLLGQRVSAYNFKGVMFASLVEQIAGLRGIKRIRFTAPYPADIGSDLLEVMARYDVVENRLHLPLQSGSDKILRMMVRGYTTAEYLQVVESFRKLIPDAGLSTDLIVGFPGESDSDFQATLDIVKHLQFDTAFTFAYSERSGTPAASLEHPVPNHVKEDRLRELIDTHHAVLSKKLRSSVGRGAEILIEGPDRREPLFSMGKSSNGRVVMVNGQFAPGELVKVTITGLRGHTFLGEPN